MLKVEKFSYLDEKNGLYKSRSGMRTNIKRLYMIFLTISDKLNY